TSAELPTAGRRSRRGRRRAWVAAGVVLAVVGSAGAGFAAGTVVGGGGTQPEDVLPDSLVAYIDVDLDTAAQQKINLVRLLGRFPQVEEQYGREPDIRAVVVDWLVQGTELAEADVSEWIGDRVGAGLSWDAEAQALTPVAAISVTDEDEAVADLGRILEPDQIAESDGYLVLTGDLFGALDDLDLDGLVGADVPGAQTAAEVVDAGQAAPLAQSAAFTNVFDHLDDGLLSMYVDSAGIAAAGEQIAGALGLGTPALSEALAGAADAGQAGAVLRAEPSALELLAWTSTGPPSGAAPGELMATLPESTLLAVELTGGSALVGDRWTKTIEDAQLDDLALDELDRTLAELEAQYGITLPDDLQTLLGEDVVMAVDGEALLTGIPGIGLRSVTDPAAGADLAQTIQNSLAELTGGFGITALGTADGMVVASTDDYAAELEAGDGALGLDPTYQSALPDGADATSLVWADLSAVRGFVALAAPESAGIVEPLEAFGATLSSDDGGSLLRARLVFRDASDS
ncbi:MAG: hypothetical protein LH630_09285, partial [Actinomycetia bacterium]|nr:hypothetical protein [Actinomycetes bacterium]